MYGVVVIGVGIAAVYEVVEYEPEAGRGGNWISMPIEPIPIGEVNEGLTTAAVDLVSSTYVGPWLRAAVGDGDGAQIFRNDGILRAIMHWAGITATSFVRNKHVGSIVGSQRPDFTALHFGVPILLVEEQEDDNLDGAQADIVRKFAWIPNLRRLPFFIGIAICFRYVRVLLLRRGEAPEIVFDGNCEEQKDRRAFLRPAVNIARVLKYFRNFVLASSLRMNVWHPRAGEKWLRLDFKGADIRCPRDTFGWMVQFYNAARGIPFLERITGSAIDETTNMGVIHLEPVGVQHIPASVIEFCRAIRCVLTAVHRLHQMGYVHTDIRWFNIVEVMCGDWYLIDCYYVCKSNDKQMCARRALERGGTGGQPWTKQADLRQICDLFALSRDYSNDARLEQARAYLFGLKSLTLGHLGHLYELLDGVLDGARALLTRN
jgi:tRNA A-37 threonylcarbamoyl transferase component Bud32